MSYVDLDTIHNPAAGTVPPVGWLEQISANFDAMLSPPIVEAAVFSVSVPNGTVVVASFTGTSIDTDNMHDPAAQPTRFTATTAGWYLVNAATVFPAGISSGAWLIRLRKNGVSELQISQNNTSSKRLGLNIVRMVSMNVGDYLQIEASQDSGASQTTGFRFSAWRVGPITPSAAFTYQDLGSVHSPQFNVAAPHGWGDQIRTNFESLRNRPFVVLGRSGAQSIPDFSGSGTLTIWNNERSDVFGFHAGSSTDIVVPKAGIYMLLANNAFAANSTGIRNMDIRDPVSGGLVSQLAKPIAGGDVQGLCIAFVERLSVGQTFNVTVNQTSGAALDLLANDAQFALIWLGE